MSDTITVTFTLKQAKALGITERYSVDNGEHGEAIDLIAAALSAKQGDTEDYPDVPAAVRNAYQQHTCEKEDQCFGCLLFGEYFPGE